MCPTLPWLVWRTGVGEPIDSLLELLDLEQIEKHLFRGRNPSRSSGAPGRVFGGQVASQALMAAANTVEPDELVHSLHAYFLRPGRPGQPILYDVDRIRDGRSFTTRRVVAIQNGEAIFNLDTSFQRPEAGIEHHLPFPSGVPDPERLRGNSGWGGAHGPFDYRDCPPAPPASRRHWMRPRGTVPDDPNLHACVLTYASDHGPVGAAANPAGIGHGRGMRASLDHSIWFHCAVDVNQWLLYDLEGVAAAAARGLARGAIYTHNGVHVATVYQEALMRVG
jgi:acyl-CoA thioesterase II